MNSGSRYSRSGAILEQREGARFVPGARSGRCPKCDARLCWLRGPHKLYPIDLMSEDGTIATMRIVRDEKGDPRPHACAIATTKVEK